MKATAKEDLKNKVIARMQRLKSFYGTYRSKARRNLRLYEYSPTISLDNLTDDECVGYYNNNRFEIESDTTSSVQENVIRSCIETLVSKIASQKVRPYINTVNATFRQMQVAKQAQDYFDSLYENQDVHNTVVKAFRDACVFDRGVIYINVNDKRIERVMPWQVYVDPRESSYNRLTQLAWEQTQYPVSLLPLKIEGEKDYDPEYETVTFWQYWDLNKGKHYYYIPELDNKFEEEDIDYACLPFLFLNYTNPIKGNTSQSIVDLLFGIQMQIDAILTKIKDASEKAPILTFFVPEGSSIKASRLSNRTAQIITYATNGNMNGSPVTAVTNPFADSEWMNTVEALKQHAYEMVGISQLSATSQKPAGLNSGIALSTMEDIESDRFETQLDTVIRTYTDLAKMIIQLFPKDEDILPANKFRATITWSDIVEMQDELNIQFSAASALSKDPSTKLQQLQSLYAAGLIPQSRIAQLMDLPDLQLGYSLANNSINAVLAVIDNCLENDDFDIPDYVPNQMLCEEILNTCLSLKAASNKENEEDIQKLLQLYQIAQSKNVDAQTSAEMAATNTLNNQMMEDMANPNGQINTAINQAMGE